MLKGPSIHLRTVRKKDLDTLYDMLADVERRGPYFPLMIFSETAIQEAFNKDGYWSNDKGLMLIVDNETDRIVGEMVFFKPVLYYDAYEIGYLIFDPADRGKGITPEAMRLFVKYLFASKPIHRLQLQIQTPNIGSRRVAEKCGFKHEGTMRAAIIVDGKAADLEMYGLTREDYDTIG